MRKSEKVLKYRSISVDSINLNTDVDDLAKKIKFALENPSYCKELGSKARERVKEEYNWDRIVAQTEEVYYSLFR